MAIQQHIRSRAPARARRQALGRGVSGRLLCALVVTLLALYLAGQPILPALQAEAGAQNAPLVRLRYASFDPLQGEPAAAPGLVIASPPGGRQPHLVQLAGPVQESWRQQLTAAGAELVSYAPDLTYIALLTPEERAQVGALPFVRWVGFLQPAYRIDPALLNGNSSTVTVSLFPGADAGQVSSQVSALGGSVLAGGDDSSSLRLHLSADAIRQLAAQPEVAWIEPYRPARLWNDVARGITSVQPVWSSHNLLGGGEIIAIADTGLDTGLRFTISRDFRGRVVAAHAWGRAGDWSDPSGHGTHVAGSAVGSGLNSGSNPAAGVYDNSQAGTAPEAGLVVQSLLDSNGGLGGIPSDLTQLFAQAYLDGARVHSNSWGVAASDGGRVYDSQAQQVDRFVWEHPDMVILFAAGNDGVDSDRNGVVDLGSVTTPATAKNGLSVGASESVRLSGGYNSGSGCATWGSCWPGNFPALPLANDRLSNDARGVAAFSSRGPAPDGRLKPDLVAPGTNILSARSSAATAGGYWGIYDEFYAYDGGTSMSTPLTAGAAALVREYYRRTAGINASAALVKATLLAGAVDLAPGQYGTGAQQETALAPGYAQGWGRLNVTSALYPVSPQRMTYQEAPGLTTEQSRTYTYTVATAAAPLRVVLVWSDYPGALPASRNLVNDLDLVVSTPTGVSMRGGPQEGGDHTNNVEGVIIQVPAPGVYQVTVRGYNVPFGPQPYALAVSGGLAEPPARPEVAFTTLPGFTTPGASLTASWAINGGSIITATALLWDSESHAADSAYSNQAGLPVSAGRGYSASIVAPNSGVLYVNARAWVDGRPYLAGERTVNITSRVRRLNLPIVLTYPAPAPTPTPTPAATPPTAVQLIRNGSFEDGAPGSPPWQQYDRGDPNSKLVSDFQPRSGLWGAWMGGANDDYQQLYQTVQVPPGVTYASLVFNWYMTSEEEAAIAHDVLAVRLLNAAGEQLSTVVVRDNTSTRGLWTTTRFSWSGDFPYAGQALRIAFQAATDRSRLTNFFIDDVSFLVSSAAISGNAEDR